MSKKKKERPPLPTVQAPCFFIDTHCHLDMDAYETDLADILQSASKQGVQAIITIGIDEESSRTAVTLAEEYPMLHACIGVHPHDAESVTKETWNNLKELVAHSNNVIVGYGEIGLDYARNYSAPLIQKKVFREQLELAKELELPVVIHDREAHEDTLAILRNAGPFPQGGVMHCFSGDMRLAESIIDMGFHLSIPGVVTFKNAATLQEVAAAPPIESLLLETDGPFLSPDPLPGKRNIPSNLLYTALKVAQLRGVSMEELAVQTSKNAQRLFNFKVEQ